MKAGGGGDSISGGDGEDLLEGEGGPDSIGAADGERDVVRGGPGFDSAFVDGIDQVSGVEDVN